VTVPCARVSHCPKGGVWDAGTECPRSGSLGGTERGKGPTNGAASVPCGGTGERDNSGTDIFDHVPSGEAK
jgi:hypothetical protein